MRIKKIWAKVILLSAIVVLLPIASNAGTCTNKLFTVTIDNKLSIGDAIENLADTCDMTIIVQDSWAKIKLKQKLYFVKLKNTSLKGFLDTVLKDNNIHYTLNGNKLMISYLTTKTFRVHYISGQRVGKSRSNVIISDSSNSATGSSSSTDGSKTGMSIENTDEFTFWSTVSDDIQRVLSGVNDDGTHYTKAGDSWIGPDGKKWEYNPLLPIINPAAGMITVTGTDKQIARVGQYIKTLRNQLKTQVLIDVKILTVTFDDSTTTGVDWSQLYKLQNFKINSLAMGQQNLASYVVDTAGGGVTDATYAPNTKPTTASLFDLRGTAEVSDIVKFLATQGDVKAVSSPRVMTLNNQPAMISVGKQLYYKIKSSTLLAGSGGGNAAEGESVNSVFAGVLLDITPEINDNGIITLKINPSISDTLEPISAQAGARDIPPDMIKRQLSSVIKVKDGHHAILGGLITSQTGTKVNKVPLLGDLPLFEYAFKREEKIEKVIELVIIVTPHIIKNSKDISLRDLGYKKVNGK